MLESGASTFTVQEPRHRSATVKLTILWTPSRELGMQRRERASEASRSVIHLKTRRPGCSKEVSGPFQPPVPFCAPLKHQGCFALFRQPARSNSSAEAAANHD
jgi:hypothetical protein